MNAKIGQADCKVSHFHETVMTDFNKTGAAFALMSEKERK